MTVTSTPSLPRQNVTQKPPRTKWGGRPALVHAAPPAAPVSHVWARYAAELALLIAVEPDPAYRDLMRLQLLKARYSPWRDQ